MSLAKVTTFEIGRTYSNLGANSPAYSSNVEQAEMYLGRTGHYGYPDFPDKGNVGGPLRLYHRSIVHNPSASTSIWIGGPNGYHYDGSLVADGKYLSLQSGNPDGSAWGAAAFARMKPTKPTFDAARAIYELKDVPRMLNQRLSHNNLKDVGSYYLALEFGWAPLLRDIRDFVNNHRKAEKKLKWLLHHNGKPVRRRVDLASTSTDPIVYQSPGTYTAFSPILSPSGGYIGVPSYRATEYTQDKVWASARARYWLPGGPRDIKWTKKMLYSLYGLSTPSPARIWQVMPWTWLSDWYLDLGSLLENCDAGVADRLAYDYGYVMRQVETVNEQFSYGNFKTKNGGSQLVTASSISRSSYKSRLSGDPFGWNTNQNSLTGMQLSILGALGLSRLR